MLSPERLAAQEDQARLEHILNNDAVDAFVIVREKPTPYNVRAAVRAAFAYVEGMAHLMRQNAIMFHEDNHFKFSAAELAILKEESYSLNSKGELEVGERYIDLRRALRFTVAMFARHFDSTYVLDCSGDGWRCFCEALAIRHRVTHPKRGAELDITIDELLTVWAAFTWFFDQMRELYGRSSKEWDRRMVELRAEREKMAKTHAALAAMVAERVSTLPTPEK